MKKFVSMEIINNVFDDISPVDYITVRNVTDASITLTIYLKMKKRIVPGDALDKVLQERAYILGKMLDRSVTLKFEYASLFNAFKFKFKNWLT